MRRSAHFVDVAVAIGDGAVNDPDQRRAVLIEANYLDAVRLYLIAILEICELA